MYINVRRLVSSPKYLLNENVKSACASVTEIEKSEETQILT